MKTIVIASLAALLAGAGAVPVFATPSVTTPVQNVVQTRVVNAPIQFGLNTLNTTKVSCASSTCTLVLSAMNALSDCQSSGIWYIRVFVDDRVAPGEPVQGQLPGAGSGVSGSWQGLIHVKSGSHMVGLQVYVGAPCTEVGWSYNWGVGNP